MFGLGDAMDKIVLHRGAEAPESPEAVDKTYGQYIAWVVEVCGKAVGRPDFRPPCTYEQWLTRGKDRERDKE